MKLSNFFKVLIMSSFAFGLYQQAAISAEAFMSKKAQGSLLLDVQKLSNGNLVAIGERGHILISEDQAQNWQQQAVPTQSNLTAFDFLNDEIGVAVGFQQTIVLTEDGGKSWREVYSDKDSVEYPALFDVEFITANKVIAIGAFGLYLESNDGGKKWRKREISALSDIYGGFSHFYGLAYDSKLNRVYISGEKFVASETEEGEEVSTGLIATSYDGGRSWQKISSPYDGSFFGVNVSPNNEVYVYGLKGNIYRSRNYGSSWEAIDLNTNSGLHDITFVGSDFFVVGTGGLLANGQNNLRNIRDDQKGRAALVAINDDELLIVGEQGIEKVNISQQATESN